MDHRTTERLARLGYAARGTVYIVVGLLALLAAFGSGGATTDSKGALRTLLSQPLGSALLLVVAMGLLFFAGWRLLQATWDADHHGRNAKGLIRRGGFAASALVNLALALWAVQILIGARGAAARDSDQTIRDWTSYALSFPLGQWLVGVAGMITIGVGIGIALKGWKRRFRAQLALPPHAEGLVMGMGRFGLLARGLVFVLAGAFVILAAVDANPREAHGLGGALRSLQRQPYGWTLFTITALGLFAFGAFQFVVAWFRRIHAPDLDDAAHDLNVRAKSAAGAFL
jgi:hypothetical protein